MHTGDLSVSVVGTVVYTAKIQTQKGSNERFFKFIFWHGHSMQISGKIPFVKPQNDA